MEGKIMINKAMKEFLIMDQALNINVSIYAKDDKEAKYKYCMINNRPFKDPISVKELHKVNKIR
jgi:hypothetical protein